VLKKRVCTRSKRKRIFLERLDEFKPSGTRSHRCHWNEGGKEPWTKTRKKRTTQAYDAILSSSTRAEQRKARSKGNPAGVVQANHQKKDSENRRQNTEDGPRLGPWPPNSPGGGRTGRHFAVVFRKDQKENRRRPRKGSRS